MENLFFPNPLGEDGLRERPRFRTNDAHDLRGVFFRDTTAILHSSPFRRLKHKTQVFFAPTNDHVCTRIEHVLHVASIAATICRALDLDADLSWAIGVGHDLGHAPFGHLGEQILSRLSDSGFIHELHSLRVVDGLAGQGKGLNLTFAVRDGIVCHCGERFEQAIQPDFSHIDLGTLVDRSKYPATWEGCVVRMSDKIAYLGRDLEDALRLRFVKEDQLPAMPVRRLGSTNSRIIDTLINDLIATSLKEGSIGFSSEVYEAFLEMKEFNYRHIYTSPLLENYHDSFERILTTLFSYLGELFDRYGRDSEAYHRESNRLASRFGRYIVDMSDFYEEEAADTSRIVTDFIAGMTDDFAIKSLSEIMMPRDYSSQFEPDL